MPKRTMLVLEEGSCPFMDEPDYSCCWSSIIIFI